MPDLTIKDAPESTVRALESIAKSTRRTVSAVALEYLPKEAPMSPEERSASLQEFRRRFPATAAGPDSTALIRRDRDGVSENELTPDEAVRLVREFRESLPDEILPDSTPGIRADRETR